MSDAIESVPTAEDRSGERIAEWARTRMGLRRGTGSGGPKARPDHWSFLLGEICLSSFVVLLVTGVYLTFYFHPSTNQVVYDGSYSRCAASWCPRPSTRRCTSPSTYAAAC